MGSDMRLIAEFCVLLFANACWPPFVLQPQAVTNLSGAILKTIELTKRRFDEVDEAFAYDEGEGDRSLQYWREAHTEYHAAWKIRARYDAMV
jgi:hypothetical protein